MGGLQGRALEALAGEGGVGRERVNLAPGSVAFGDRGNYGERVPQCPFGSTRIVGAGVAVARGDTDSISERLRGSGLDSGCEHGATGSELARTRLDATVEASCAAQDSVANSVSSIGSANLDQVASVGSSLLRACNDSVKVLTSAVGSARFAPHIYPHTVRHWIDNVKKLPGVEQLLRVLVPGSPVCVARGGNLTAELAYGNHPNVAPHAVAVHQEIRAGVAHGGPWCLD